MMWSFSFICEIHIFLFRAPNIASNIFETLLFSEKLNISTRQCKHQNSWNFVVPGFKNKTRYTPYVSLESQITYMATNKG
jgi:hypothetical protein